MNEPQRESARPDPLIDEVRAIRAKISAQFGNDVGKLCEHLRSVEAQYPGRVVSLRRTKKGTTP